MFGSLGFQEILFIAVVVLLIFGPRRLPEIGHTMGKFLGEFRRATTDLKRSIDTEVTLEEVRRGPAASPAPAAAEETAAEPAIPAAAEKPAAEPTTPTAEKPAAEPAAPAAAEETAAEPAAPAADGKPSA